MGWKAKYYEVFGLTETATKSEVKRQYRKLAMKFHPDKNPDPKAHKLFLDLTEAYQILMDDSATRPTQNIRESRYSSSGTTNTKSAAEQRDERYRQGRERYQQYLKKKQLEAEQSFQRFTTGIRWKIFKISAIVCFIVGALLLVDRVLPSRIENHQIVNYGSRYYNGFEYDNIKEVNTDKGLSMYLVDFYPSEEIQDWPAIEVKRSFIFRNPTFVTHVYDNEVTTFNVDFSVINIFPYLSLLLIFPILVYRYKKRSGSFYMSYFFSQYLFTPVAIYIIVSQWRWLHMLTLGFV